MKKLLLCMVGGTICTAVDENGRLNVEEKAGAKLKETFLCSDKNVDLYIAPSRLEGEIYDSVRIIGEHKVNGKGIRFLFGMTNEMTYVKLLLAYSNFSSYDDIEAFLETEYNFELIERV